GSVAVVVRRGRAGRSLRRLAGRHDLPDRRVTPLAGGPALAGAAAAHLRPLRAESGVGECRQRLVQGTQLVDERREVLARVQPTVQPVDLGDEAVETLE